MGGGTRGSWVATGAVDTAAAFAVWWRGLLACGTRVERSSLAGMGMMTGGFCTVVVRAGGCCAAVGPSGNRFRLPGPDITALCALLRCTFR